MAGLAVATVSRLGAADVVVASRTEANARRLADQYDARAVPLTQVQDALGRRRRARLLHRRDRRGRCRWPWSPAPGSGPTGRSRSSTWRCRTTSTRRSPTCPGVSLFGLARLAEEVNEGEAATDVAAVREIVAQEIAAFLAARRSATVTPTVVALRTMATGIVDGEMERLLARLPDLDPDVRAEVEHAVRRVADKLLHQPTVRVKELANETGAVSYAAALAELFSLDPDAVEAVTRAEGMPMTT